ncbi:MAG TPA: hypothetical protein VFN83_04100 [Gemmatimonadales bacterium]|nr:hypothetical protein [Gemmatimonadales bacterium]
MGHKHLLLGLAAAALVAACGSAKEQADSADKVNVAAMRDSIRKAKGLKPAAQPATPASTATASSGAIAAPPVENAVQRETFAYAGGTRDPFASLINLKATGPTIDNLQLVGVYEARSGGVTSSVAVLREKDSGKRYMLREGEQLGRMQVVKIATKDVTFQIEDFGFERQATLSLRKQEDMKP